MIYFQYIYAYIQNNKVTNIFNDLEKFFTVFEFIKIFLYKAKIYRKNAVILDFVEERQTNGFIR